MRDVGCAICGQTSAVCPADKKLYAIRDVTSTVASIPLITGSIVCKKAAEGLKGLILDVKMGRAAFMQSESDSVALAESMVAAGAGLGIKTQAVQTRMDDPIGYTVGNALEILESIQCLKGQGPADLEDLVCVQGGMALAVINLAKDREHGASLVRASLHDGTALAKFREMIKAQGGDPRVCDDPEKYLPQARAKEEVLAHDDGYVAGINALNVAIASLMMGAGRTTKDDVLDLAVGIELKVTGKAKRNEDQGKTRAFFSIT